MQEYRIDPQTPNGSDCGPKASDRNTQHHDQEGDTSFGCPLRPVIVRMVHDAPDIKGSKLRIDVNVSTQPKTHPRPPLDHLQRRNRDLATVAKWILVLKSLPKHIPPDDRRGDRRESNRHRDNLAGYVHSAAY